MPIIPNLYKKDSSSNFILGALRVGDIRVAVEEGWNETGYRLDYGPTSNTGWFAGPDFSNYDNAELNGGGGGVTNYLVNFTGTSPSYTNLYNGLAFSEAITNLSASTSIYNAGYGIVGLCAQRPTKNIISLENSFWPMVTSGLTSYYEFRGTYCKNGFSGLTGTNMNPAVDLTYLQNKGSQFNAAKTPCAGTVRSFTGLIYDGISTNMNLSGSSNILTGNDFTWFMYHSLSQCPGATPNNYIWASVSGAQKNFTVRYYSGASTAPAMVIETSATTYSSTTTGTNFNNFSTGPISYSWTFNRYDGFRYTVLRKSGTTVQLYWWYPLQIGGNITFSGLTKMWEVTINDWGYVNPNIPISIYYNPVTLDYTAGAAYTFGFYNRALSDNEMRLSVSGAYFNFVSTAGLFTGSSLLPWPGYPS